MGNLTKNFSRWEFACKCGCGFDTVDVHLVKMLQHLRDHFDASVTINSGCRCAPYNMKIKGSKKSQHKRGRAADFTIKGIKPSEVQRYLEHMLTPVAGGGLGKYDTFTHADSRTYGPVIWVG